MSVGSILTEGGSRDRRRVVVRLAVYAGPIWQLQLERRFYLGVGAGVRYGVGGFRDDGFTNPLFEVGLRVPVTATLYLLPDLALVLDAGASGSGAFVGDGGAALLLVYDASLGFRWP